MTQPATPSPAYPVIFDVEPQLASRNRLSVGFRLILAIPHILLVGTPGGAAFAAGFGTGGFASLSGHGVLGTAAFVMAVISWFAIVFSGRHPRGLWDFAQLYMRWRTRTISHGEGRYFADDATLDALEAAGRIAFRYSTPGGRSRLRPIPTAASTTSLGIVNERGNVLGMMPHPERAVEPLLGGGEDGLFVWRSALE